MNAEEIIIREFMQAYRNQPAMQPINLDKTAIGNTDLLALRLKPLLEKAHGVTPAFKQSKFAISYITSGTEVKHIESRTITVTAHHLVFIRKSVVHQTSANPETDGYYIAFNLNFFLQSHFPVHHIINRRIFAPDAPDIVAVPPTARKRLREIFEALIQEEDAPSEESHELQVLLIVELILLCDRLLRVGTVFTRHHKSPALNRYLELLETFYKEHHSVQFYAQQLGMHPNSLNALMQTHTNRSAKKSIEDRLRKEAEQMLRFTGLSAKEIAYELGFFTPSYFFRFFKRQTGMSPLEFRGAAFEKSM